MSLKQSLSKKWSSFIAFFRRNYASIMMVIIFFCVFGLLGYAIDGQRNHQLEEIIKNQQEIQAIGEDVIFLADRGIFYNKCVARLFVEYTQNNQPIKIEDITKCDFVVLGEDGNIILESEQDFTPTRNDSRQNTNNSRTGKPPAKPIEAPEQPRPNEPTQPPENNKNVLERITDWLGDLL